MYNKMSEKERNEQKGTKMKNGEKNGGKKRGQNFLVMCPLIDSKLIF